MGFAWGRGAGGDVAVCGAGTVGAAVEVEREEDGVGVGVEEDEVNDKEAEVGWEVVVPVSVEAGGVREDMFGGGCSCISDSGRVTEVIGDVVRFALAPTLPSTSVHFNSLPSVLSFWRPKASFQPYRSAGLG